MLTFFRILSLLDVGKHLIWTPLLKVNNTLYWPSPVYPFKTALTFVTSDSRSLVTLVIPKTVNTLYRVS